MSVRIHLDKPQGCFTNLDYITGKAILSITGNETVTAINVKLEGDSKTRLLGTRPFGGIDERFPSRQRGDEAQVETEIHKLLYKAVQVFPTPELQNVASQKGSSYTLPPGQHEYAFKFKIPFNNDCSNMTSTYVTVAGLQMQMPHNTDRHIKKTLPPSLNGLPGQAEIRYYVKATVQRAAFYKENFRAQMDFKFFPIEPPRAAPNKRESYARRQHQFAPAVDSPSRSSFFRRSSTPTPDASTIIPPLVSIDGRLPDPAVVTCNEPLPLRVLITKLNDSPATMHLQLLHIELVANTTVRAHHLNRTNGTSWVIVSRSNMQTQLIEKNKIMELDRSVWKDIPLPNTVAPSFDTCNITRSYTLDIKVGLSYGHGSTIYPELAVQAIRMPLKVFSGIAPPPALLNAMRERAATINTSTHLSTTPSQASPGAAAPTYPGPSEPTGPEGPFPAEAPPSYEDAIAEDLGPVDGPRGEYHQVPMSETDGFGADEKGRKGGAQGQRLFS
ncbi:MAG: hypothetical protein LQ351_000958 [Letrouitia transgressa]|nr:MAG: hypothetical protein LQ351_000958 [Letrouitia transgressa]